MAKKVKKSDKWQVVSRTPDPFTITLVPSNGGGTFTFANLQYKVWERRGTKGNYEWRERTEQGDPLYYDKASPEGRLAMKIMMDAMTTIYRDCRELEGGE